MPILSLRHRSCFIRIAQLTDLESITNIYNDAVRNTTATFDTEAKTSDQQKEWFEKHTEPFMILVAEEKGAIKGWASVSSWSSRCAYSKTGETSVYIGEEYQGKGVGKALMRELLLRCREVGFHTLLARIAEGNPHSTYLHKKLGFQKIGTMREVGRKFGSYLDVDLYQLFF